LSDIAGRLVSTARVKKLLLNGATSRWLLVAAIILFDLIGFRYANIEIDWSSADGFDDIIAIFVLGGLFFDLVRRLTARLVIVQRFAASVSDFCFSALQLGVFVLATALFIYILARTDRPLIDAQLGAADHLIGFDWTEFHIWVDAHPDVHAVLQWAYFTHLSLTWALVGLGSLWFPGRRNGELIWSFMISLLACCAIFCIFPSVAMGGEVASYVPVLKSLRSGDPMVLHFGRLDGIIQFPSFHAASAIIFVNAARHRLWALIPFVIFETPMLISTPPIGGHYLTDVIGGIVVALISIALARWLEPASLSAGDNSLVLLPAVPIEVGHSTANRAQ